VISFGRILFYMYIFLVVPWFYKLFSACCVYSHLCRVPRTIFLLGAYIDFICIFVISVVLSFRAEGTIPLNCLAGSLLEDFPGLHGL